MTLTVEQMLKIENLRGITVLAGKRSLAERIVKTVVVIDVPDSDQWVRGGEFLITSGYLFADNPLKLIDLVRGFARRNAAALGIKIGRFLSFIPKEVLMKADEIGFPILYIPPHVNHADIINPVLSSIVNSQYELLRNTDAIRNRFMEAVVSDKNIVHVLDILEEFLQTGTAFADIALSDLYVSQRSEFLPAVADPPKLREILCSFPKEKVILADRTVGFLIFEKDPYAVTRLAEVAIKQAQNALLIHLQREKAALEIERRHRDEFVSSILYARVRGNTDTLLKSRIYGWDPSWKIAIAALRLPTCSLSQEGEHGMYYLLTRNFKIAFPGSIGLEHDSSYIALIPVKANEDLGLLLKRLVALREVLSKKTQQSFEIALSSIKQNLLEASDAFAEAMDTLDVIERMGHDGSVLSWDGLGVEKVLSLLKGTEVSKRFWQGILGELIRLQKEELSAPWLMETLQALVEHNWELKLVSSLLDIHYNTLRYRIKLLEDILGMDLSHGGKRFEVTLAFKLYKSDISQEVD